VISIEDVIVADDLQILHFRLSNQHSVEGIAMVSRERTRPSRVVE
jgi:hypothetical protein